MGVALGAPRARPPWLISEHLRAGRLARVLQDLQLFEAMSAYAGLRTGHTAKMKWSAIARAIGTRSGDQASKRWREVLEPALNRSKWSHEDDSRLLQLIVAHRCCDDARKPLEGRGFSATDSRPPPPTLSDAAHTRLDCSWNEIARQHGARTVSQVRTRYALIMQLKAGICASGSATASAAIPSSIPRLGLVRPVMYRAKLATSPCSSSSGANDDGYVAGSHSPSFPRKISASSKRSRGPSTRSATGSKRCGPSTAGHDARRGLETSAGAEAPSFEVSGGTRNARQLASLFGSAGAAPSALENRHAKGCSSPAQWATTTTASMLPSSLLWSSVAAPGTAGPESLVLAAGSGASIPPPSFIGPDTTLCLTSVPASFDALTSSAWHSAPTAAPAGNEIDDIYQPFVTSSWPAGPVANALSLPPLPLPSPPLPLPGDATSTSLPWWQSSPPIDSAASTSSQRQASSWVSSDSESSSSSCDGIRRSSMSPWSTVADGGDVAIDAVGPPAAILGLLKSGEAAKQRTHHGQKRNIFGGSYVL